MIDLIEKLNAEVILVVQHYLGSINHTLLSLELLKQKKIKVRALIFNGDRDEYSENIIANYCHPEELWHIPRTELLNKEFILKNIGN